MVLVILDARVMSHLLIHLIFIISFLNAWNTILLPVVILQSQSKFTNAIYLNSLGSVWFGDYAVLMTSIVISTLPMVVMFLVFQRYILKFPAFFARTNTALVLKEPKTKTSTRKVFLPKTVAEMLKERYQEIQEYKELFGDEFQDFNLVFCNANGRPMESQIITRALQKLIKDNDLPPVVFHSLRHSSITYKLKLNGGDIKSVQGDSGHAQVKMVTDVYSHIIDEDRRLNAQRFEETFYQKKNPSEVNGATVEPKKEPQGITEEAMLNYMVQNPDFLQKFKVLLGVGN